MSDPNKPKAGLRERLQTKRWERQQREAEHVDRARREGVTRPEDIRLATGRGGGDYGRRWPVGVGAMPNARRGVQPLRWWRDKQRGKRERTGPSFEAQHEQRNTDKVVDPTVVAKNARRMFPP